MLDVTVYYANGNVRSRTVAQAMAEGIRKVSRDQVEVMAASTYKGVNADVAVFYGLAEGLDRIMQDYIERGTAVYIDLGYWNRRQGGRYNGFHKICVNSRHPTAYFQRYKHCADRLRAQGISIRPWRKTTDGDIIVAGMSAKAAGAEHMCPESWERDAIARLQRFTDRKIWYRPKPNWSMASNIRGSVMQRSVELPEALKGCHAIVTHHSNVAVDSILAGIPSFCWNGVAAPMSLQDINRIEEPWMPKDRQQWAADIAYCQWSVAEMKQGLPWKHLKNEGLIV